MMFMRAHHRRALYRSLTCLPCTTRQTYLLPQATYMTCQRALSQLHVLQAMGAPSTCALTTSCVLIEQRALAEPGLDGAHLELAALGLDRGEEE
jgi:hypothetical protein